MEEKRISVVLPVYNGSEMVGKSMESVLDQTYKNIELIIVNDCSTDNTLDVIKEYEKKDNRIKILNNKTNLKLPRSLNEGFKIATGDYYTWTSDDNMYHSDALYRLSKILDEKNDIDLVYSSYTVCDKSGKRIREIDNGNPSLIRLYNNIGASFLYRKELAKKVGEYDPELFLAEDYEFFLRCYEQSLGKFYYLKENLYDYTEHENNLTSKRMKEIRIITYKAKMKHFDFLYSRCNTKEERIEFLDNLINSLDYDEKVKARNKLYSTYKYYMIYDIVRRIKNKIKRIFRISD